MKERGTEKELLFILYMSASMWAFLFCKNSICFGDKVHASYTRTRSEKKRQYKHCCYCCCQHALPTVHRVPWIEKLRWRSVFGASFHRSACERRCQSSSAGSPRMPRCRCRSELRSLSSVLLGTICVLCRKTLFHREIRKKKTGCKIYVPCFF